MRFSERTHYVVLSSRILAARRCSSTLVHLDDVSADGLLPSGGRSVVPCFVLKCPYSTRLTCGLKVFAVPLLCQSPCKSSRDQNRRLSAVPSLINRRYAAEQPPARCFSMEHPRTVCRRRHVCWIYKNIFKAVLCKVTMNIKQKCEKKIDQQAARGSNFIRFLLFHFHSSILFSCTETS